VSPSPDPPRPDASPSGASDVVDARGQRCPLPVIRLARLVRDDPTPRLVTVLATDPAAAHDVPAWCRMRGHRFAGARDGEDHTAYDVEVLPTAEPGVSATAPAGAP
jgi:TusA-related sulfurtransferase